MSEDKLQIRVLTECDYEKMSPWHSFWKFPQADKELLPNNGLGGLMVYKGDVEICAGYLYFTNSKFSWIEYIVSNPGYRENDRAEAIVFLIEELTEIAKSKGSKVVFTSVKNQNLIKHYKSAGYSIGSEGTKEMVIRL